MISDIPSVENMDEQCKHRRCLKFINPTVHPDATIMKPYIYEKEYFGCFICNDDYTNHNKVLNDEVQPYPIKKEMK